MSFQQGSRRGGGFNRNKGKKAGRRADGNDNNGEDGEFFDTLAGGDSVNGNELASGSEVFNSADEGNGSGDEEEEEGASVVNASLIVNLSNANVSQVIEEGGRDLVLADESTDTVVAESPVVEGRGVWDQEKGDVPGKCVINEEREHMSGKAVEKPEVVEMVKSPGKPTIIVSREPDKLSQPLDVVRLVEPTGSTLSNSSEESSTLADSEVEKLMSGGSGFNVATLPSTVTVLKAPNGVTCYLVGTAHFSHQSQVDVVNTIGLTNPTLVLLELCSSRRNILSLDEETVLREVSEMNFQKVRLAMSNSGAVQGVLHLLLLSMSAQLTKKLGMAPGGEFRAAMREARKIPGCVLLLGDRPFNITISRALAALSLFQKIKLGWQFLTSNEDITKEEIERCKELDAISMLLKEMTGEFPSITEVFVNERDVFLAHSLYLAATSDAHGGSGRERVVVGVVGMGHVPGIVRNWGKTTDESVTQLLKIPETPISSIIIRKSIKFCWYGVLAYGVYRAGRRIAGGRSIDFGKLFSDKIGAVKNVVFKSI